MPEIFEPIDKIGPELAKLRRHIKAARIVGVFMLTVSQIALMRYYSVLLQTEQFSFENLWPALVADLVGLVLLVGSIWRPFICLGTIGAWWVYNSIDNVIKAIANTLQSPERPFDYNIIRWIILALTLAASSYILFAAIKARKYEQLKRELTHARHI